MPSVVSLAIVVGGEIEAAHGGAPTMAESSAILRGPQYVVIVTWRRRGCGETRKRIDERRNVAVVLSSACSWVDGPDAHDDNGHHPTLPVVFAVLATTRSTAAAPSSGALCVLAAAKSKHAEEVERWLVASYTIAVFSAFVVPQSRCYAAVLQRLQKSIKCAIAGRRRVVFADQGRRSGSSREGQQPRQHVSLVLAPPQALYVLHVVLLAPDRPASAGRTDHVPQAALRGNHGQRPSVPSQRAAQRRHRARPMRVWLRGRRGGPQEAIEIEVQVRDLHSWQERAAVAGAVSERRARRGDGRMHAVAEDGLRLGRREGRPAVQEVCHGAERGAGPRQPRPRARGCRVAAAR
jgi:hypothetical protein